MKVIFFGTPDFAAKVLETLLENKVEVVAVISKPDKAHGRALSIQKVPVKVIAEKYGIPVFQPEKVSDLAFAEQLKSFNADLFVVVAYGEILKQHVLDIPKNGCINLHASLLPKYRGAAPIQRAIIEGEKTSGVSIINMVKKMDAGDILLQKSTPIPLEMNYGELSDKLLEIGSLALLEVIEKSKEGKVVGTAQEESHVAFAPKIELEDCKINFSQKVMEAHNLIRGVNPEPGAWCILEHKDQKKRLKIYKSYPHEGLKVELKTLTVRDKKVFIGFVDGALELLEVQLEGKKRMEGYPFSLGFSKDRVELL